MAGETAPEVDSRLLGETGLEMVWIFSSTRVLRLVANLGAKAVMHEGRHFYQPPRENPWLEAVEVQDSAAPYHDWNERVTAECYAPNTAARRVDQDNRILDIVNNFEKISFNVGPTLLAWLERHAPDVYAEHPRGRPRSARPAAATATPSPRSTTT